MVTIELTAFEAMQVQTALGERIVRLNAMPRSKEHPFEASVVIAAVDATNASLRKLVEAFYPEPEQLDPITASKGYTATVDPDGYVTSIEDDHGHGCPARFGMGECDEVPA